MPRNEIRSHAPRGTSRSPPRTLARGDFHPYTGLHFARDQTTRDGRAYRRLMKGGAIILLAAHDHA